MPFGRGDPWESPANGALLLSTTMMSCYSRTAHLVKQVLPAHVLMMNTHISRYLILVLEHSQHVHQYLHA